MQQVERWATAISNNLPNLGLTTAESLAEGSSQFYAYAKYIVEPEMSDPKDTAAYCDFMDADMDNWKHWVYQTFGDAWGHIAYMVCVDGY